MSLFVLVITVIKKQGHDTREYEKIPSYLELAVANLVCLTIISIHTSCDLIWFHFVQPVPTKLTIHHAYVNIFSMNFENLGDESNHTHPEVTTSPEAMQRPRQTTLRNLMQIITDKTQDEREKNGEKAKSLVGPGEFMDAATATVRTITKGTRTDHTEYVGQIHREERVGNDGDTVFTNWFILDTPDGLHIEKHVHADNLEEYFKVHSSSEELYLSLLGRFKELAELEKASAEENELGLSFVSEQEARELIAFLEPLESSKFVMP
jgi:hypothetical protein